MVSQAPSYLTQGARPRIIANFCIAKIANIANIAKIENPDRAGSDKPWQCWQSNVGNLGNVGNGDAPMSTATSAANVHLSSAAKRYRLELAREMSKAEIARAQRLTREWLSCH